MAAIIYVCILSLHRFIKITIKEEKEIMLAYTYIKQGKFELIEKPKPELRDSRDAIVRVTLGSICTSDLHIKHGGVPRAVPGITVGHEMVGIVEQTGRDVKLVKPGDRVTVNVETFCGECFFCRHSYHRRYARSFGMVCHSGFQARTYRKARGAVPALSRPARPAGHAPR